MVKYPHVNVELAGQDGNAFFIIGRTASALRSAGVPKEEIDAFVGEATSGDYYHVLQTVTEWVTTDEEY